MKNKKVLIVVGAVVFLAAGVGFWYWQSRKTTPTTPAINTSTAVATTSVIQEAGGSIGAVIFEKTQEPLKDKLPETNPLKRVMINPF